MVSKRYFNMLLVDDDDVVAEMIAEAVLNWFPKIEIDRVSNGRGALEKIKEKRYHFMITDFKMPVMDGGSLLKSLSQLDERDIPRHILMLSSYLEPGEPSREFVNINFMDKLDFSSKLKSYLMGKMRDTNNARSGDSLDESTRVTPWRDEPVRVDIIKGDLLEIRQVKDISIRGLGIVLADRSSQFIQGGEVDLVITLPRGISLRTRGKIIHTGSLYSNSMGIEFIDLGPKEKRAIRSYVKEITLNENW